MPVTVERKMNSMRPGAFTSVSTSGCTAHARLKLYAIKRNNIFTTLSSDMIEVDEKLGIHMDAIAQQVYGVHLGTL